MNEASLESSLRSALDRLFTGPLRPKIEHQSVLSLRFGHHQVTVDGENRSEARGRLDVLLKADSLPVAVLELKRPGASLTDEDETQAWSYARLIDPMPPFYVVTNGETTRIFRTYDRKRMETETIDNAVFEAQLQAAAGAAAADEVFAIRFLLGRSPEVFRKLFQGVTEAELAHSTGGVGDYSQPLAETFRLPRIATAAVRELLTARQPVVFVVGPALSGKTNVLAELCDLSYHGPKEVQGLVPLYLNCSHRPQGIFQSLATGLTKQTKVPATAEDVRLWLTTGLVTADDCRPVLILDGWPSRSAERWEAELSELLDLVSEATFSLVVVLDEGQAERMLNDPERGYRSRLGTMAKGVKVKPILSDAELCSACHALHVQNGLDHERGIARSIFHRLPFTWRFLASFPPQTGTVPSVLGVEFIHTATGKLKLSAEHREYLRKYARAVVEEDHDGPLRELLTSSPGWVTWETAEGIVGVRGLDRLQEARLIRARTGPHGRALFSMQVPPVLAAVGSDFIVERLNKEVGSISVRDAARLIVRECQRFPYGPVVGAAVVCACGMDKALIEELLSRPPVISPIAKNAKLAIPLEGEDGFEVPEVVLHKAIADGGHTAADPFPYLILSYVAPWLDYGPDAEGSLWEQVVEGVGSAGIPLMPVEPLRRDWGLWVPPHLGFDLSGGRSMVAMESGIIEPITAAIRDAAIKSPDVFGKFVERLLKNEAVPLPLLNRAMTAAASVAEMNAPHASVAQKWADALEEQTFSRLRVEIRTGGDEKPS